MSLPFTDITTFIYTFYGIIAISILFIKSVNIAVSHFRKGFNDA